MLIGQHPGIRVYKQNVKTMRGHFMKQQARAGFLGLLVVTKLNSAFSKQ